MNESSSVRIPLRPSSSACHVPSASVAKAVGHRHPGHHHVRELPIHRHVTLTPTNCLAGSTRFVGVYSRMAGVDAGIRSSMKQHIFSKATCHMARPWQYRRGHDELRPDTQPRKTVICMAARRSAQRSRPWHLSNVRCCRYSSARRRLPRGVDVLRFRYRLRGWNTPRAEPVADALASLDALRARRRSRSGCVGRPFHGG